MNALTRRLLFATYLIVVLNGCDENKTLDLDADVQADSAMQEDAGPVTDAFEDAGEHADASEDAGEQTDASEDAGEQIDVGDSFDVGAFLDQDLVRDAFEQDTGEFADASEIVDAGMRTEAELCITDANHSEDCAAAPCLSN